MDEAVVWATINGTVLTFRFREKEITNQIWDGGLAMLTLRDGEGGVRYVKLRCVEMIDLRTQGHDYPGERL